MIRCELQSFVEEWNRTQIIADVRAVIGDLLQCRREKELVLKLRLPQISLPLECFRGLIVLLQSR